MGNFVVVRTHPTLLLIAPVLPIHLGPKHATLLPCNLPWLPLPLEISTKFFFFLNLVFYGTCYLNSAYLRALSPATLLLTPYPLVQPDFSFPVTPCTFQPLCLCSACACCRVCPFPLSLWKFDSFLTASSESLLLSEVPLLPRIRCDPFHLLYTLHLIL